MSDDVATIGAALRTAIARLRASGMAHAGDEARRLVTVVTGVGALSVATQPDRALDRDQQTAVLDAIRRRAAREPLSRIVGEREFYGRTFRLAPSTLDPRADTETLIEAALELIRAEDWQTRPLRILDIGTGSGCLLLTLLAELPTAKGLATDISPDALATAEHNATRLGVADRARFTVARSLSGVEGPFDLVVSNPPYIPSADIALLDEDVRCHDPIAALDGGPDGLAIYRQIASRLPTVCPSGWSVFEVGSGQSGDVSGILAGAAWPGDRGPLLSWNDLGGHTRVVAIGAHHRRLCE